MFLAIASLCRREQPSTRIFLLTAISCAVSDPGVAGFDPWWQAIGGGALFNPLLSDHFVGGCQVVGTSY
jgi:hypothetical protein